MKQLTIKIERRLLQLAETETQGKRVVIKSARSFPLPENPDGGALTDDPEALAHFIGEAIKRGRLTPAPAALLFHSALAPYHEYYHRKMSASELYGRARAEAEAFLPPGLGSHIVESERYSGEGDAENRTSAIFAVKDGFLRALVKSLKAAGIKIRFASSSLSVWSDLMRKLLNTLLRNDVHLGTNPVCVDVGEDCIRFLFFVHTRQVHRRELPIPEELSDDELLLRIEEATREIALQVENREDDANAKPDFILLAGARAGAQGFADRVAGRLNTPCRNLDFYMDRLRDAVMLGGEFADRNSLYIRVVSLAGAMPKRQKKKNLLYGGFRKRRERGIARATAVVLGAATLAAMSAMPIANWYLVRENAESLAIITRPIYAEAREKLAAQRQLNALLQNHMAEEAYMQNRNLKYGGLLYQISRSLFAKARIERIEHENNGNSMDVTFTTSDPDAFLEAKEKMNSGGNLTVADPVVMTRTETALWRCVATISWDVPAMGGMSE
jgi:Tfp pilus assembly PilM family ATPase